MHLRLFHNCPLPIHLSPSLMETVELNLKAPLLFYKKSVQSHSCTNTVQILLLEDIPYHKLQSLPPFHCGSNSEKAHLCGLQLQSCLNHDGKLGHAGKRKSLGAAETRFFTTP